MWIPWKLAKKIDATYILTYFGHIWGHKRPENLAHRGQFSHTHIPESTNNVPVNQVSWSQIKILKTFWENSQQLLKLPFLHIIFIIKDQLKKFRSKKKSASITEGAYLIWKKVDGRWTAWHQISSADHVSSWDKNQIIGSFVGAKFLLMF